MWSLIYLYISDNSLQYGIIRAIHVVTMYIDRCVTKKDGIEYVRYLLRESFRKDGKVTKRTVANLSNCSQEEIRAMTLALKHKGALSELSTSSDLISIKQGVSIGAVWVIYQVAKELGIVNALGSGREGKLALWQVIARVIDQGSRLSAVRLARVHACAEVVEVTGFNEDSLYRNLDWLSSQQSAIEDSLFRKQHQKEKPSLYLYDVTSSYFEGQHNELAAFGYNRDKKQGKKQIVAGLLCNQVGEPLAVQVFKGNTSDLTTFGAQVEKAKQRFGAKEVTFVGDRGMIKSAQITQLTAEGYYYITAITKAQIESLLNLRVVQLSMFDTNVAEITTDDATRYVLRRNDVRAHEIKRNRDNKMQYVKAKVAERNAYLLQHPKASLTKAQARVEKLLKKLRLSWVSVSLVDRSLALAEDETLRAEEEKLDGCYAIKSNLPQDKADKQTIHARYKDLSQVEWAFRTSKTTFLELRPIFLRLEDRTRAHAFVVMLAYKIVRRLATAWAQLNLTVQEGVSELASLCLQTVSVNEKTSYNSIPEPRDSIKALLDALGIPLPPVLPISPTKPVDTNHKLQKQRKH